MSFNAPSSTIDIGFLRVTAMLHSSCAISETYKAQKGGVSVVGRRSQEIKPENPIGKTIPL